MIIILLPTFISPLSQPHKGDMRCLDYKTPKFSLEDCINPWLDIIVLSLNNAGNIIMNETQNWLKMNNTDTFFFEGKSSGRKKKYRIILLQHSNLNIIETWCIIICHMTHEPMK